jgi:hypothetical protein
MKLPNAQRAVVERKKIVHYLLNAAHPDNGGKAQFFAAAGFSADRWQVLAEALLELAANGQVTLRIESEHGEKYLVRGRLRGPAGRSALIQSVWIIDRGREAPRLVTAYPR